ncbi:hypothetical protein FACS1894125_7450 [Actinomycetota bacterium]|nr:hypothetical protein FACS1894125_7450 [Actinomycetota bacterium]
MFGSKGRRIENLERELKQTKRESQELISNVSHELRTPLAAIEAIVDNVVEGVTDWDHGKGEQILEYINRQDNIITYLLDLAKVESGELKLKYSNIDARNWVFGQVEPIEMLEPHKELTFIINVVPDDLKISIDPARFGQVLTNLLTNAIRHATDQTEIEISVFKNQRSNTGFCLLVFNEGEELFQSDHDIFERFKSSATQRVGKTGGTGIGLSIAKWITELHNGSIEVADPSKYNYPAGTLFKVMVS